uniref:SSD domain-containing protein n=1 Tax=Amphimedon queenslandica TaxID=400682 RepID=A0A1X7TM60_AMPQE
MSSLCFLCAVFASSLAIMIPLDGCCGVTMPVVLIGGSVFSLLLL